jgi:hypothetical protein
LICYYINDITFIPFCQLKKPILPLPVVHFWCFIQNSRSLFVQNAVCWGVMAQTLYFFARQSKKGQEKALLP